MNPDKVIKIAICDDMKEDRDIIGKMCEKFLRDRGYTCCVNFFKSGRELVEASMKTRFGLIFLDVQIETDDAGILAKEQLLETSFDSDIIFMTNHSEQHPKTHGRNVSGFLIKPVNWEDFSVEMKRAMTHVAGKDNVAFIKVEGSYLNVMFSDGESKVVSGSLDGKIGEELEFGRYVRCHKSYAVNMEHVVKLDKKEKKFIMDSGCKVPISRRRLEDCVKRYVVFRRIDSDERWGL